MQCEHRYTTRRDGPSSGAIQLTQRKPACAPPVRMGQLIRFSLQRRPLCSGEIDSLPEQPSSRRTTHFQGGSGFPNTGHKSKPLARWKIYVQVSGAQRVGAW